MPENQPPDLVWIELHVEAFGSESDDYLSIPRAEWEEMTEDEQEKWIEDAIDVHVSNSVSAGGGVVAESEVPAECRRDGLAGRR